MSIWIQKIPKIGDVVRYGSESHQIPSDIGTVTQIKNGLLQIVLEREIIYISKNTELLTQCIS